MRVLALALLCLAAAAHAADSDDALGVWPGKDWQRAPAARAGLDEAKLDAAAQYATKAGGGAGCVIRHGVMVKEWGKRDWLADIKSATKGSVGITMLGLAVDGLVKLDDRALMHYPALGAERPEVAESPWRQRITVRMLATMTAGFDDARPARLVYEPGTRGIYSNDTSNMLAEMLTLRFKEDLRSVLKRRVMQPIGAGDGDWTWRDNQYRAKTVGDLSSREFAAGIRINYSALARIGYLYLRDGQWKGKRILSRDFIRQATAPTDLPAPFSYYAMYWGSNARGTYKNMPRDTYWALGLGDSFVVVCPSLDIVAVRLGVGSNQSRLPGDEKDEDWGRRVEGFFQLVAQSVRDPAPPSPVIKSLAWAHGETIRRAARGSDNWPLTWADDGALYGAYGDGNGFDGKIKLSLGLSRITGGPADFAGRNIPAPTLEQIGDGKNGKKASGLLCLKGTLYLWARNAGNAQLAWSADKGATWTWADWTLKPSFGSATFLNVGRDHAGAPDDWVYVYSHDADSAYIAADAFVLARVKADRIRQREAYEFFAGMREGQPTWDPRIESRQAVFTNKGRCYRSSVTYNAALKRYFWCQTMPGEDPRQRGGIAILDAPAPWGPWTCAYYSEDWDTGPGETSSFPTAWINEDGRTMHLVFSGEDCFSVRKVRVRTE